ncbi:MAG: thiamine pyrophosphate-dependent dehydrogenase E1 component subunit alpha [Planctomycetota bacterium]
MITTEKDKVLDKTSELNRRLYKKLYLIRRCEQEIIAHYSQDCMKTPMHMSMGAEAIAVGVCEALAAEDQVFGTYRSHALYLAKTEDTDDFFAEMYGKETALLKGKGGSMHLCAADHGFMGTSAIVASIIPVAAGCAFANKRAHNGKMVAVFFGDGAVEEGVFWESLNVASLMRLPILFVCEDNGLAVHTPKSQRRGFESVTEIVSGFNCLVYEAKTTDTGAIHTLTREAVEQVKSRSMPAFVRLEYFRHLEHVGVNEDFDAGYRSRDESEQWLHADPVRLQRETLRDSGWRESAIEALEMDVDEKVSRSLIRAQEAEFCSISELDKDVFA